MTEEKSSTPVVYVALGDSTGVGVGATRGGGYVARLFERIERQRPGSRVVNLCVSGATTADVLRDQMPRFEQVERPTLVTLGIGVNDVQRLAEQEYAINYEDIIKRVRKVTDAPLVVTNIPDIACAPGVPDFMRDDVRRRIGLFNKIVEDIAARHALRVVDAYTPSHALLLSRPEFFCDDGFHPSDEGYEFWTDSMWPTVQEALR